MLSYSVTEYVLQPNRLGTEQFEEEKSEPHVWIIGRQYRVRTLAYLLMPQYFAAGHFVWKPPQKILACFAMECNLGFAAHFLRNSLMAIFISVKFSSKPLWAINGDCMMFYHPKTGKHIKIGLRFHFLRLCYVLVCFYKQLLESF